LPANAIEQLLRLRRGDAKSSAYCRVKVGERTFECSFVSSLGTDELLFRLTETGNGLRESDRTHFQKAFMLTSREAEILLWISRGKRPTATSAKILSISPRTVNKHLEQVFVKLGVENRAAAAAAAVRALAR